MIKIIRYNYIRQSYNETNKHNNNNNNNNNNSDHNNNNIDKYNDYDNIMIKTS